MHIYINQPFGIGDCIFPVTIARKYMMEGHQVTWGVFPQFVEQLRRAYPDINWIMYEDSGINHDRMDEHERNGYTVLPLRWACELLRLPYDQTMRAKYDLLKQDYKTWAENAMWNRDYNKETTLYNALMEQNNIANDEYIFINKTYGSATRDKIIGENMPSGKGVIELKPYYGYSLFDWAAILEKASEIHTVSTSIFYILEKLDIKCDIHLYPRPNDPKFKHIDYLFTKKYILHT